MPPRRPPAAPPLDALIVTGEEPGAVSATLTARDLMRANLHLRTASRVVVRLSHFKALTFADVEKHGKRVPWDTVVVPGQRVRFRVTCRKSRLYHSGAVAQRLMEALALRVRGVVAATAADDEEEGGGEQLFVVRLFRDQLVLSVDSSGALLHRRGYRQATAKAPLRETLAAAMLMGAGWDGSTPLIDPMCGSGTIPIEAAMIARRIAPGLGRHFAFQQWPGHDAALWRALQGEAASAVLPRAAVPIVAGDRDAGAVEATRANAERAGVTGDLSIVKQSLSDMSPTPGPGLIILNPPYGIRVGDKKPLRNLFAQLGNVARARAAGWRVAMLSADRDLERQVQLPFSEQWKSSNGGIPVRLITAEVPIGAK